MNFLSQQQELSDRLKAYDETISSDATRLKRWLNRGQQYICGKMNWEFMNVQEIIQTTTDYTTGTVSTMEGSTSITFSGTISTSRANSFIKFSDSNDWYQITAHTAGTASATISPAAINTNTTATFTIRKLFYQTSTAIDSILDMKQWVTPVVVRSIERTSADVFAPLYYDAGTVYNYFPTVPDSSGNLQWSFLFSPDSVINVVVRGVRKLSDLSADGDTSIIPERWQDAIVDVAAHYGFTGLDDNRAKAELERAEIKIADMARVYSPDLGRMRVIGQPRTFTHPVYGLPANYGPEVP